MVCVLPLAAANLKLADVISDFVTFAYDRLYCDTHKEPWTRPCLMKRKRERGKVKLTSVQPKATENVNVKMMSGRRCLTVVMFNNQYIIINNNAINTSAWTTGNEQYTHA